MSNRNQPTANRRGFTLIEVLTVIVIIGILAAISIPAIGYAVRAAKSGAIRMEISSMEQAIEKYRQTYGDYPPDFSSAKVVTQHYNKLFPRMSANDKMLLTNLLYSGGVYQAAAMDRAEALVWTLGGYSDDIQRPFTGPGGPLVWVGPGTPNTATYTDTGVTDLMRQTPTNFQINNDRVNRLHDFDQSRLNFTEIDTSLPMTGSNRYLSTDDAIPDLFLTYAATEDGAPFVYFDSRTYDLYDLPLANFNGYASGTFGQVRPYLSDQAVPNNTGANYADQAAALRAWKFVKPDTFQIISAGLDNSFGSTATYSGNPIYFQYPTGKAIALSTSVDTPGELIVSGASGFQEQSAFGADENFQLDNLTNFSTAKIVDDVED